MDTRIRSVGRRAAMEGSPDSEAVLLIEQLRSGEITREQILLAATAGILPACIASGIDRIDALDQVIDVLPVPSNELLQRIVPQIETMRVLDRRFSWGFTVSDFVSLPVPKRWPSGSGLATLVLVPYLDTVQATFDGLWQAIQSRHANARRWDDLKSDAANLRLLEGITHPGKCLRWESIDLGANWDQENGIAPRDVRDPATSPHAGILAAAALHTKWVEAMDGRYGTVPLVWLPGYQWGAAVPRLYFDRDERQVQLDRSYDDSQYASHAVPTLCGE